MRSTIRVCITLAVVLAALFAGHWLWNYYMYSPWTRDARVRADIVTIAPDVSGAVVGLSVKDNQRVSVGDPLMQIDPERYDVALEQAKAVLETRKQQLNLRQHEASRRARLGPQAISAELRENSQISAQIALAEYHQAEAEVKQAALNVSRSRLQATRNGYITNLQLAEGNYVNTGEPVLALVDEDSYYVQAYFEETKLPKISVGDEVEIWLMSYQYPLKGQVQSISRGITDRNASPDTQLLANVEPTFNWVRLAQRIPVRIKLDNMPEEVLLSAGMTASVKVLDKR
ncbi:HlyD family secretion protein [Pseudomonas sp. M30-35]|uniref:efflux RND transporter periplasmic adaptor subunit n=1 Tax=Pseudomonas sp. M30-35 TaxID=1981174 RepID=UPI000B3BEBB0|nr:HlyD family secretion protein [Pseudomonas sp. M30-35]ARU89300.1 efflux transporter periplasmic adaptor subunit [Pseudomonas sp. M30-35]